ncbi:MAG TPA: HD domain-containing phosphohydrolase [Dermatophilaceae bacterium]|nr:HD domain-containing phosphohydrolase [Dermatophilaceae bacterium]
MTPRRSDATREVRGSYPAATLYIVALWLCAAGLTYFCWLAYGPPIRYAALLVLTGVGVAAVRFGSNKVDDSVQFAASNIILLTAVAMLAPVGAGVVGLAIAAFRLGPLSVRGRAFNMAMFMLLGLLGGLVYDVAGGLHDIADLTGVGPLLRHVGLPLAAASFAQIVVNAALLSGVLTITRGVPFRIQVARLLSGTGVAYLAYGLLAFLLVVLWVPARLGWTSVLFTLALLLGARWAITQYGEERRAHERALDVLVAAIETRAPGLAGHSARVSALAGHMAEELSLRPHQLSDVRRAGMLHDVGLLTLPASSSADSSFGPAHDIGVAPQRGADLLKGVSFLSGALEAVAHHGPKQADVPSTVEADVVRVADRYDLLAHVAPEDERRTSAEAMAELRTAWPPHPPRVLEALDRALERSNEAKRA